MSDTYLGFYVLNAGELSVKSKKGKYKSGKELDKWEKVNRVDGKGIKGEIHITAQFFPTTLALADNFIFSKDNTDIRYPYALISWKLPNGS